MKFAFHNGDQNLQVAFYRRRDNLRDMSGRLAACPRQSRYCCSPACASTPACADLIYNFRYLTSKCDVNSCQKARLNAQIRAIRSKLSANLARSETGDRMPRIVTVESQSNINTLPEKSLHVNIENEHLA